MQRLKDTKFHIYQKKDIIFLLGRICCTGEDSYKIILVFDLLLSSLILHSNKKVTNWISTRILSEKYNFFDANFEPTMCDFANGRVSYNLTTLF